MEKILLGEGKDLEEVKASFKDQASGTGFRASGTAREWAKVLRREGVIRINKCFNRFQLLNIITINEIIYYIILTPK